MHIKNIVNSCNNVLIINCSPFHVHVQHFCLKHVHFNYILPYKVMYILIIQYKIIKHALRMKTSFYPVYICYHVNHFINLLSFSPAQFHFIFFISHHFNFFFYIIQTLFFHYFHQYNFPHIFFYIIFITNYSFPIIFLY